MPITFNDKLSIDLQIASFVQSTVQIPIIYSHEWQRKTARLYIWEARNKQMFAWNTEGGGPLHSNDLHQHIYRVAQNGQTKHWHWRVIFEVPNLEM